jgi:outer membrane protein assembly factor BamB
MRSDASLTRWVVRGFVLAACLVAGTSGVLADDWPQWLGPNRDSVWHETGILAEFPAEGPRVLWRAPLHGGYTGPAVAEGRVFVMDYVTEGDQTPSPDVRNELQGTERVICFDAATGEQLWAHTYSCNYQISYPAGPRATPTVAHGLVYALGAQGDLQCLEAESGKLVWERNFARDFQAETPIWGFSGHPLVDGENLICIVGGPEALVVAFDRRTGEERWRSLSGSQPGYSAPVIMEAGGTRQLLIWHAAALASLDPATGNLHWSQPLDPNYGMSIVTPRWSNNLVFVGGIVHKSMVVQVDEEQPKAEVLWYGTNEIGIDPTHSTPFAEDGHAYGVNKEGDMCAMELRTGKILWSDFRLMPEQRRVHSGTVFTVKHEDRYFLMTDSGELVIAKMSPERFEEIDRAKILEPTGDAMGRAVVWSHPAFANRCVYARNDKELVCISLAER